MTPLVLIVDDERSNLESLERTFAREGWRVALAASGARPPSRWSGGSGPTWWSPTS